MTKHGHPVEMGDGGGELDIRGMLTTLSASWDGNIGAVVTRKISADEFVLLMVERRAELEDAIQEICGATEIPWVETLGEQKKCVADHEG